MNTLISIVIAIVLNFLGVEVQERNLAANAQVEIREQTSTSVCSKISASDTIQENSSIRIEHNSKLSK